MKVLHVFYNFLPDLTGSSIRSAGIVSGQLSRGMDVVLLSSPFQPGFSDAPEESYRGVKLYRAHRRGNPTIREGRQPFRIRLWKMMMFPGFVRAIVRIVRLERITHIHAHSTFYCAFAAWWAARLTGCIAVYEFRSVWEERSKAWGFLARVQARLVRAMETLSLRLADRIVTINDGLKEEIASRGVPLGKISVVPNAVEDDLVEEGRKLPIPDRVRNFGYVGNISDIEGLDTLVHAFRRAFPPGGGEPVRLVFRGKGPYVATLAAIVEQEQDDRIHLGGPFSRQELAAVYASIDCVVLPRRRSKINETVTPLKPLEAMAFGRVVAVSDVGGLREVIGKAENAWMFPADDIEALAAGLRRAYEDGPRMSAVAAHGRTFVEQERRWNAIAARYLSVYRAPATEK